MGTSRRAARVGATLRNALGELLQSGLKDPGLESAGLVSVTGVKVSADLGVATVYVVCTDESAPAVEAMLEGLARATPHLRTAVAGRLGLRRAPELRFRLDEAIGQGRRIEAILQELAEDEKRDA